MQEEKLRIIKLDAEKAVRSQMSRAEKTVHAENDRLVQDLDAQRSEMKFLENQSIDMLQQNSHIKLQLQSNQKDIQEKANTQFELKRTILQLQKKMEELNQNMTQAIEDFEKEKMLITAEFERQCQQKEVEIYNYKNKIAMREKEVKTLKGLAQMILDQRSDIEQFFLEGIYDVMGTFPGNVDEMTTEQKEQVLRIIFSKMNTGVPAIDWKGEVNLPIIN